MLKKSAFILGINYFQTAVDAHRNLNYANKKIYAKKKSLKKNDTNFMGQNVNNFQT